jgi:Ca2+-binding EF-hand superfamily protein
LLRIHYSQAFNEIDADGSGYITSDEVVVGFGKMGVSLTLDEAKAIVKDADTNQDGKISYDGKEGILCL